MKFIDLEELEDGNSIEADLCIVGSGPAGVSIAKEFVGSPVQVLILEGGGLDKTLGDRDLYDIENVGVTGTAVSGSAHGYRSIGGTSVLWNGRCASFDEIDFESRAWLPYSGWPISYSDIRSVSRPIQDESQNWAEYL